MGSLPSGDVMRWAKAKGVWDALVESDQKMGDKVREEDTMCDNKVNETTRKELQQI